MRRMMSMITAAGLGAAAMTMMNRRTRSRITNMARSMTQGNNVANQMTEQVTDQVTDVANNMTAQD